MKKLLLSLLILSSFLLVGCVNQGEQVELPEVAGMHIDDALLAIAGEFILEEIDVPTSEYMPGVIIDYQDYEAGEFVKANELVYIEVASQPENAYVIDNEIIEYVSTIGYITGPDSPNYDMLLEAAVYGTDLGIPVDLGDETLYLFGDTFSGDKMTGFWHSNFMALSDDKDLYDGLTFSSLVTRENGIIKPFAQGLHNSGNPDPTATTEVTKIPTGGILIGDVVYVFYMSVRYWGTAGEWLVSYNQVVKANKNDLTNFVEVEGLRWTESESPNFGQITPVKDPDSDMIYLISIPGGRSGGAMLARVDSSEFENKDQYEYYVDEQTWVSGDAGLAHLLADPYYLFTPGVSEPSLVYNPYLEQWVATYLKGGNIIMMTADEVTGPWSSPMVVTNGTHHPLLYGGFLNQSLMSEDGQKMYMILSEWGPYQSIMIEILLK